MNRTATLLSVRPLETFDKIVLFTDLELSNTSPCAMVAAASERNQQSFPNLFFGESLREKDL